MKCVNEKEENPVLPRSERQTPCNKTCIKISAEKKQQRVMDTGESLLCEGKHLFADWTLFSGNFAASLGPELGTSPQD